MMLRVFIISLLAALLSVKAAYAQISFNDSLLLYEYGYFNSSNTAEKQALLIKKVNLYLKHDLTGSDALKEIKRVNTGAIADTALKADFLWNAAIVAYLNNDDDRSRFYTEQYGQLSRDSSLAYNLLLVLANKYNDTAFVNARINYLATKDSLFKDLSCFISVAAYNKRHLNAYLIASLILPGSGAMANGYVLKGFVSLALTAGSVYGIVKLVQYGLYINAVLWGTGVGLKFYAGNIRLTEELFYRSEAKQKNKLAQSCELKLKELLNKYPLELRGLKN